jgi:hypothetical protein
MITYSSLLCSLIKRREFAQYWDLRFRVSLSLTLQLWSSLAHRRSNRILTQAQHWPVVRPHPAALYATVRRASAASIAMLLSRLVRASSAARALLQPLQVIGGGGRGARGAGAPGLRFAHFRTLQVAAPRTPLRGGVRSSDDDGDDHGELQQQQQQQQLKKKEGEHDHTIGSELKRLAALPLLAFMPAGGSQVRWCRLVLARALAGVLGTVALVSCPMSSSSWASPSSAAARRLSARSLVCC